MSCAYVCATCQKRFHKGPRLYSPWHYVSRSSYTLATLQIPPESHRNQRPGIGGAPSSRVEPRPRSAAHARISRSTENEFLRRMFRGHSAAKTAHFAANIDISRRKVSSESHIPREVFSQDLNRQLLPPVCTGKARPDSVTLKSSMRDKTLPQSKPWGGFTSFESTRASSSRQERSNADDYFLAQPTQYSKDRAPTKVSTPARVLQSIRSTSKEPIGRSAVSLRSAIDTIKSGVGRAIERQDVSRMDELWQDVKTLLNDKDTADESDVTELRSDLYAHILWGFMSVRRPNHAVLVWNKVMESNLRPTAAMWDTMLNGFGAVRNSKAVENIWNMMVESGFKPDKRLWVTRIRALAASGSWQSSLQAFEEMMVMWLRAVKMTTQKSQQLDIANTGDTDDAPKPNIEAVNGLVLALVQCRKQQQLMQVLSWAKTMGLQLDTYTFNPIIRMALRDGNVNMASQLLTKMQHLGIKRDIATYTMILQSIFRRDRSAANKAQVSVEANSSGHSCLTQENLDDAYRILEEIQQSTLKANAYTYSALISGLLKHEGASIEAAQAVVDYMEKRNITLSSQIYTSLIMAYFMQPGGANVSGAVEVWQRARADKDVAVDEIFYDRLIEGFAKCGEVAKMKTALAQAGKSGKAPGWIALAEAIGALGRAEDWSAVREIVQDVQVEEQSLDRVRKGKGKKFFWDTARAMGLEQVDDSQRKDEMNKTSEMVVDVDLKR